MTPKKAITFLLSVCIPIIVSAEIKDIGTPYIRNFTKQDYKAGTQSWGIAQDLNGFMYFANNDGLLLYNGVDWEVYKMPNLSMVRSIFADEKGEIYVGAYNDIGKMVRAENGKLTFSSMKDQLPEKARNFDDVWNIFSFRDAIVFQSYYSAFFFDERGFVKMIEAPSRFQSAYSVAGRLIFNDIEKGLMEYDGTDLLPLKDCSRLAGQDIWSVISFDTDNRILICTLGNGMFIYDGSQLRGWDVPVNKLLIKNQIFSATVLHDNYFALGTILDGVFIIDNEGNVVQHIDKKKGLQNNTILDIYPDRTGNLWLALDNGIDYVTINSPVTFVQDPEGIGAGYTSIVFRGRLYLGTNQGLYFTDWDGQGAAGHFTMIPGTYGQVWYLGVHNDVLICGHNNGTYEVDGATVKLIGKIPGGWKYYQLKRYPGYMIGGTYSGLTLYRWTGRSWEFERKIDGFNESFRVFEEDDNGDIWMSHGFKGIYRVRLDDELTKVADVRFYTVDDGLPSNYYLNVFRIKGKIVIASETGIYEYLPSEDKFVYSLYYNQILGSLPSLSYMKEDDIGNIWYVADNRAGVFRMQEDFSYQHVTTPFLLLSGKFIHGFENVYPYTQDHVFFAIESGFAHYSPHAYYKTYQEFTVFITRATALNLDSLFYYGKAGGGAYKTRRVFTFPFRDNSFRFTFAAPVFDNPGNTEYACKLSGIDREWSSWSTNHMKEYSNLPDGRYVFMVKARNQLGTESQTDSLEFIVQPPWYKSLAAYIGYVIFALVASIMVLWTVNKRIEVSNRKERLNNLRIYRAKEQEYIRQALESEKEIIRIKSEKLQTEMLSRDKEVANQAMNLIRKNEFLLKIRDELNKLTIACGDDSVTGERIQHIINRIKREVDHNKQREVFESAFDEVNEDFLNRLKGRYPELTPTELRLCAFMKMNLTSKEIAPLMNISVRGVEICRYRVRKKMGISRDINLSSKLFEV